LRIDPETKLGEYSVAVRHRSHVGAACGDSISRKPIREIERLNSHFNGLGVSRQLDVSGLRGDRSARSAPQHHMSSKPTSGGLNALPTEKAATRSCLRLRTRSGRANAGLRQLTARQPELREFSFSAVRRQGRWCTTRDEADTRPFFHHSMRKYVHTSIRQSKSVPPLAPIPACQCLHRVQRAVQAVPGSTQRRSDRLNSTRSIRLGHRSPECHWVCPKLSTITSLLAARFIVATLVPSGDSLPRLLPAGVTGFTLPVRISMR